MSNEDIIRALNHTNAPSELIEAIGAALDDLDRMYQMEAENAALRARIDDCAAALMADAEGR